MLQRLQELVNSKNETLDNEMKEVQSLLSARQVAKFILWIDQNPACMQLFEALWQQNIKPFKPFENIPSSSSGAGGGGDGFAAAGAGGFVGSGYEGRGAYGGQGPGQGQSECSSAAAGGAPRPATASASQYYQAPPPSDNHYTATANQQYIPSNSSVNQPFGGPPQQPHAPQAFDQQYFQQQQVYHQQQVYPQYSQQMYQQPPTYQHMPPEAVHVEGGGGIGIRHSVSTTSLDSLDDDESDASSL